MLNIGSNQGLLIMEVVMVMVMFLWTYCSFFRFLCTFHEND